MIPAMMAFKTSVDGKQEHNENNKDKNPKDGFHKEYLLSVRSKDPKDITNFHCFL